MLCSVEHLPAIWSWIRDESGVESWMDIGAQAKEQNHCHSFSVFSAPPPHATHTYSPPPPLFLLSQLLLLPFCYYENSLKTAKSEINSDRSFSVSLFQKQVTIQEECVWRHCVNQKHLHFSTVCFACTDGKQTIALGYLRELCVRRIRLFFCILPLL